MTDKALRNALAKRDELAKLVNIQQQRIDEWKREIKDIDGFVEQWHKFAEEHEVPDQDDYDLPPPPPPPESLEEYGTPKKKKATQNSKKEDVAEAARELIQEAGHPLSRAELFDKLTERGLVIEGAEPQMVLSTMLWRMKDRIVRLEKGGYWLKEVPYAPEYYHAEKLSDELFGSVDDAPPPPPSED